ncbi:MAG: hypothetical protein JWO17_592 [Actinomycetia bacterium]|nr:hypothetical protein [Actinomycetes bacterium]
MRSLSWVVFGCAAELISQIAVLAETSSGSFLKTAVAIVLGQCTVIGIAFSGRRLSGPRFGAAAALVYAVLPLLGIAYSLTTYRHIFVHEALPELVGLRHPLLFAVGAVTAVVFAFVPRQLLGLAGICAGVAALAIWGVGPLSDLRIGLHETAWSITFAEWALVAGILGVARRSGLFAVGLGGWIAFVLLRAAAQGYADAAFWKGLAPATPALALLLSAVWFLVPRLRPAPLPYRAP